jgi:hypothetical protein
LSRHPGLPRQLLALALLSGTLACTRDARPTLALHLVAASADFEEVNVQVREVHLEGPGGWTTVSVPDATLNLVRLNGGAAAELVERTALPPGTYKTLRLVLGSAGSVRLRDGSLHVLSLPTSMRHGLEVPLGLEARPGTDQDLVVELDAARSVHRYPVVGGGDMYVLRPHVRSVERLAHGAPRGAPGEDG